MSIRCLSCMKEHEDGISKCPFCGYNESADEDAQCHLPPRTILKGRYMIGCCLGSGGFGVTYVAWDSLLEKKVAIKEYLPSELATRTLGETHVTVHDDSCVEKYQQGMRSFLDESRRLAKFNSINGIVSIFDCFDGNGTAYIVMECLEGKTLQQIIKERKKIPFNEVLPVFLDVLEALSVVHEAGMMHRDIAPDNIFICNDGSAKLIDFGAARYMTTTHSRSLSMILKIGYAPIEQYTKHGNQGSWTDIYAVAASLYHALTGVVPPDSYDRVEEDKMKKPSLLARRIPKHAEIAILNALNIIETNRTQTAKEFADSLKGDIDVSRIKEKIIHEDTGRVPKWAKKTAAAVAALILVFGTIFVATGGNLFRSSEYYVPEGMARVPYVINETVSSADAILDESVLHMVVNDRVTDLFFENNFVLLQNPRSGNVSYIGSAVSTTASMKPDEYHIPDLTNFTQEAAVEILEAAGFVVTIESGQSDSVAPGAVIEQNPLGNTLVYEGASVTLVVNTNKGGFGVYDMIKSPDYVGMQFEKAQKDALERLFYVAISRGEYSDSIPKGEIIEQSPAAESNIYQGSTMLVTVSLGKRTIIVPNLTYLSEEAAIAKVEERLLVSKVEYMESSLVSAGLVVEQKPLSGVSIYEGGEMTIYISTGYKVKVPDVVGLQQEEAQNSLLTFGLGYAVTFENSDTIPEGQVMTQSIEPDTEVSQGTVVSLVVSAGTNVINVKSVSLNQSAITLEYGEVYTLIATVKPNNATTTAVSWSSSNSSIASVSEAGVITANKVGVATVTVTTKDGGYAAHCDITVVKTLSSLTISSHPDKMSYFLNEEANFAGMVLTATYSDGSTENVTSSNSTTIGGFDSSSPGDKGIVATYSYSGTSKTVQFNVHIRELVSIAVTSKPSPDTCKVGASEPRSGLVVTATYDDGATRDVTRSCSISGFSSARSGRCTIQVTYTEGDQFGVDQYYVTVQGNLVMLCNDAQMSSIEIDNRSTCSLSVKYTDDADADTSKITWKISDNTVASLSPAGGSCTITALTAGETVVTAEDDYGSMASITIGAYGPIELHLTEPNIEIYSYYSKKQTRHRDWRTIRSSTEPATPSGFVKYGQTATDVVYGEYGGWSSVVKGNMPNDTDTTDYDYRAMQYYYHYKCSACGECIPFFSYDNLTHGYYARLSGIGNQSCKGDVPYSSAALDHFAIEPSYMYHDKYAITVNGVAWFYDAVHKGSVINGYVYRTRSKTQYYEYYYEMPNWSDWSDTIYTPYKNSNEERQVQERTVYVAKLRPKRQ